MMTVEDPIEYALDGVGQTQVNPKIELDFCAVASRSCGRIPTSFMIGEIRDLETAQIAVQRRSPTPRARHAAHERPASAMTRLADMGVEPYLLASSLLACWRNARAHALPDMPHPGVPTAGEAALLVELGAAASDAAFRAVGCPECRETGTGRSGIYELIVVDESALAFIHDRAPEHVLRAAAIAAACHAAPRRARWLRRRDVARRARAGIART